MCPNPAGATCALNRLLNADHHWECNLLAKMFCRDGGGEPLEHHGMCRRGFVCHKGTSDQRVGTICFHNGSEHCNDQHCRNHLSVQLERFSCTSAVWNLLIYMRILRSQPHSLQFIWLDLMNHLQTRYSGHDKTLRNKTILKKKRIKHTHTLTA